jgi:hypothetical protein
MCALHAYCIHPLHPHKKMPHAATTLTRTCQPNVKHGRPRSLTCSSSKKKDEPHSVRLELTHLSVHTSSASLAGVRLNHSATSAPLTQDVLHAFCVEYKMSNQ